MLLSQAIDKHFRGNVLVTIGGSVALRESNGYSDLPNKIRNRATTIFASASAGKVFVAVGILQLVERGLLKLDDKIKDFLDFDLKQIDPDISIHELLSHTSGIPDYFDESVMSEYEDLWADYPNYKIRSNADLLPLFIDKPMMYEHGTKFQYNNTGFVVLGMVIEKITGKSFDEYLDENIFKPAKMLSTGYYELDRLPGKCATNYIYDEKRDAYRTNIYSVDAKGTGAGGAFTTCGDIQLFWENLFAGKLISKRMVMTMVTNHSGEANCYGYGIWLKDSEEKIFPYIQGFDPGVSFISRYDNSCKMVVTLVSNYGDDVWSYLDNILYSLD